MKNYIFLFLKGLAMGAVNKIPGVSGGTVAFITGIYEDLINLQNQKSQEKNHGEISPKQNRSSSHCKAVSCNSL